MTQVKRPAVSIRQTNSWLAGRKIKIKFNFTLYPFVKFVFGKL